MDAGAVGADFARSHALRSREAGYSVAQKCLEEQAKAELRDPSLRSRRGVRLHEDARSWYLGTLGEIEVGRMLDRLGPDWLVLHSVPIGAKTTDVDHVVIGPAGVFVINTKHHRGANVWIGDRAEKVGGTTTHYADRSAGEARKVAPRLGERSGTPVAVNPVVALVGVRGMKDSRPASARAVSFVAADDLVRWLQSRPAIGEPGRLRLIKLAAEEPSTWHVDPRAADTMRVMTRFERLRDDVERLRATPASARPGATSTARRAAPARGSRRTKLTPALGVFALVVLIPTAVTAAAFGGAYPSEFWIGSLILFGVIGLATQGTFHRRKHRRQSRNSGSAPSGARMMKRHAGVALQRVVPVGVARRSVAAFRGEASERGITRKEPPRN